MGARRRLGAQALGARSSSASSPLLAVLALGNLTTHGTIGFGQGETKPTNSSRGTEALERHFPAGLGSPLTAVVGDRRRRPVVAREMERLDERAAGAAGAGPTATPPRRWSSSSSAADPYWQRGRNGRRGDPRPPPRDRSRRPARRHPGRELRHRADQRPRHEADRAPGPARRRPDPARGPARPGRPRLPDRHRASPPSPPRSASPPSPSPSLRDRRARLQPRADVLHLPRRARGRLQHLPDDPGARGGGRRAAPARAPSPPWSAPAASSPAPA